MQLFEPDFYRSAPSAEDVAWALQILRTNRKAFRPPGAQAMPQSAPWFGAAAGGLPVPTWATATAAYNGPSNGPRSPMPPPNPYQPSDLVNGGCGVGTCGTQRMPTAEELWWLMRQYGPEFVSRIVWATRGGTVGQGYPCAPQPLPELPRDANGCEVGWQQCKLPLPVNAMLVDPGESVDIVIQPPYDAVADSFMYIGPSDTFEIESLTIGLTNYIQGPIASDTYSANVNGVDYSVQWAPFDSSTPAVMRIRNYSALIATHRGTAQVRANRKGG
jgi:hypothetical protein